MDLITYSTHNPAVNVALDEVLLASVKRGLRRGVIRIWINYPSIIIGYTQRPCDEASCEDAERLGIPIIRRISGGGTVYHDLGNINISIVSPSKGLKPVEEVYREATEFIIAALERLGIKAWVENHSDVVVKGYKVSGTAAAIKDRAYLVHSTLLVSSNIEILKRLIKPRLDRVARGEVTPAKYNPNNLRDIAGISLRDALEAIFSEIEYRYHPIEMSEPTEEEIEESINLAPKRIASNATQIPYRYTAVDISRI
ncbi:MAG: lipoate--protein ligase family protein [Sulfolobales archaeon]